MINQEELHNQCLGDNPEERATALRQLKVKFRLLSNKQQAWNDLIKLTSDEERYVRRLAASTLGSAFSYVPEKQKAWNDLIRLTSDHDNSVRRLAAYALDSAFSHVPDKQQAWNHLIKLTDDQDSLVRSESAYAFNSAFSLVPDKQKAWNDLIRLTNDGDWRVSSSAADALGSAFSYVPDKQKAWNDLRKLTIDNYNLTFRATFALCSAFPHMPDKQQAWDHLILLTDSPNVYVSYEAASSLGSVFSHVPDKQQAWNDLILLTDGSDTYVGYLAAYALSSAFSYVPDKQKAWNDLIRLTNYEDSFLRYRTTSALGSAFSYVPDKQKAWNDLIKLRNDQDIWVRAYANHSLGKASIFKASQEQKEEDYKQELEKAIEFFEIAATEMSYNNPAQFCLPFYRSFYTIVFKKDKIKEEVDKYLAEAKDSIEGSKSKELLLEAVENLANTLKEVQNLENLDLKAKKGELNFYRKYCDRAAELMRDTEEVAPFATAAMKKGLPILDRNLKELIEEIQNRAKIACKKSRGTTTEEIACSVNKEIQKWEIGSQEEMTQKVEDIAYILRKKVANLPENKYLLNKIEAMRHERNLTKQYENLLFVIGQISTVKVVSEQELDQKLDQKLQKFNLIFDEIIYIKDKLNCISFDISKIKLNSANVISNLKTLKEELEKLSKIEGLNTLSIEKLDYTQAEKLNGLNNDILERLGEIKILICELSKDSDELYQEYSRRLDQLKQSKLDTLLQRYSAAISLISFAISGIQIAH